MIMQQFDIVVLLYVLVRSKGGRTRRGTAVLYHKQEPQCLDTMSQGVLPYRASTTPVLVLTKIIILSRKNRTPLPLYTAVGVACRSYRIRYIRINHMYKRTKCQLMFGSSLDYSSNTAVSKNQEGSDRGKMKRSAHHILLYCCT